MIKIAFFDIPKSPGYGMGRKADEGLLEVYFSKRNGKGEVGVTVILPEDLLIKYNISIDEFKEWMGRTLTNIFIEIPDSKEEHL